MYMSSSMVPFYEKKDRSELCVCERRENEVSSSRKVTAFDQWVLELQGASYELSRIPSTMLSPLLLLERNKRAHAPTWHTSRNTDTSLVCPIRYARSWACWSNDGFQFTSKIITLDADCKLIPTPPALVEHRNTNDDALALKVSTSCCRLLVGVDPSSRV